MLRTLLLEAWAKRRGLARYWNELDRCTLEHEDDARWRIARRLQTQMRYFGSRPDALPEWRDAARIADPEELWRLWPALPILRKDDLREQFSPERIQRDLGIQGERSSTGGSTGEPTPYLHDAGMLAATTATRLYARLLAGWHPGMKTVCVWGSERDIGRQRSRRNRLTAWLRGEYLVDGYRLTDATVDQVLDLVRRHQPVALYGFTSMLEYVAERALERGIAPFPGAVRTAWNGGEMLFDRQRETFRRAFSAPVLNLYGGRELSVIACEPAEYEPLRVMRPYVFVEIVDDQGRPAQPGESGRILVTSTVCRGTPFLRYEIGDLACYDALDADASGIRAIAELQGRDSGILRLAGGRKLHCIFWNHLLKEYPEIHQFQVAVHHPASLTLRLAGRRFGGERAAELEHILAGALGEISFRIEWRDALPQTAQGKLVQIVQEPAESQGVRA